MNAIGVFNGVQPLTTQRSEAPPARNASLANVGRPHFPRGDPWTLWCESVRHLRSWTRASLQAVPFPSFPMAIQGPVFRRVVISQGKAYPEVVIDCKNGESLSAQSVFFSTL